ncbi:LysR family transcriptional regulator [Cryobacterium luteum]
MLCPLYEQSGRSNMSVAVSMPVQAASPAGADLLEPISTLDDVDIRHIRYFLAVARCGSVSAAATELNVSQPSLSQQIIRLERRVGFCLFNRKPRGVEITSAGLAFLKGVEHIPHEIRAAMAAASPHRSAITIGICGGIPYATLSDVSEMIRQSILSEGRPCAMPRFQLKSIASSNQGALLRVGDIDLGIVRMPLTDPSLTIVPFSVEDMGVVMATGHPLGRSDIVRWADLRGQRLLWGDPFNDQEASRALLTAFRHRGWDPMLESGDIHRPELTIQTLHNAPDDTVAVCPRSTFRDYPNIQWRPLAGPAITESLAFAAVTGTRYASLLGHVTDTT